MRLYLINPCNPLVSMTKQSFLNKYRVWKPLGLLTVAGLTPPEWQITLIDENLGPKDYASMPPPDLVGITAFTSQAARAYEVAADFRRRGIPVVMGGIHATMCCDEALQYVNAVVMGEAESVWPTVLDDAKRGTLMPIYRGEHVDMSEVPPARHDLLTEGYLFGSIQTTRGCPLACSFCSVSAFNGKHYRLRPIDQVVQELQAVREKRVLVVDDNLIGTRPEHIARAKELFRAIIASGIRKEWICQATINFGDDEELLELAAAAGCIGTFIGFESLSVAGLTELRKRFNIVKGADPRAGIARIHRHGIGVVGSFIIGLDSDTPGVGRRIADAAIYYGVDLLNVLFLTPLPGTPLWDDMAKQGRIIANDFPHDWRYYTLSLPVARCRQLSWKQLLDEMEDAGRTFYSPRQILRRIVSSFWYRRSPLAMMVGNLSYRRNYKADREVCLTLDLSRGMAGAAHQPVTIPAHAGSSKHSAQNAPADRLNNLTIYRSATEN